MPVTATRPADYPKLKDYKPSEFMLETSHYDKAKADRAVTFVENLCHTKSQGAGFRFWLLPWQEQIVRDVFGIVKNTNMFSLHGLDCSKRFGYNKITSNIRRGELCGLYYESS